MRRLLLLGTLANKANFRTIAPKNFQHITINTRGDRVLDHCYSPFRDTYKSLSRPPFDISDHSSVLLLPAYRQKLKREATRPQDNTMLVGTIGRYTTGLFWSRGLGHVPGSVWWWHRGVLRYCNVFHQEVYRGRSTDKNNLHLPQPKTWINSDVRSALSAQTSAFKSGNTDDRKQASYDLRKSIKAAKRTYKNKVEEQFNTNNARSMWQGISNITGSKGNKPATVNIAASLPDKLNTFYARFEAHNTAHTESAPAAAAEEVSPLSLSVADVTRSFKRVNIRKAVGPDGIPGRVLRACAFKLARVFTDIFNLSLSLSVVPSCFKKSTNCAHNEEK